MTQQPTRKSVLVFILIITSLMLVTRLPLLDNGYGADDDGWSVARVARQWAETGVYEASRLPGYPTQEALSALVWRGGPFALNGLSALLTLITAIYIGMVAFHFNLSPYLPSLMFIFSPLVYVSSVTTIDYQFATGFFMLSLYLVLKKRYTLAGIALGLSAGARITSGGFWLPFAIYIYLTEGGASRWRALLTFTIATGLSSLACYVPALISYGPAFFYFNEKVILIWFLLRGLSMDFLGALGMLAVLATSAVMAVTVWRARKAGALSQQDKLLLWICGVSIALTLLLFVRVPHEIAYLIPILPFLYLLNERYVPRVWNIVTLAMLLVSCLFTIGPSTMAKGKLVDLGPVGIYQNGILYDYAERKTFARFITEARQRWESTPGKKALVVGFYQSRYFFEYPGGIGQDDMWYSLDEDQLASLLADGYTVYSLPDLYHRLPENSIADGRVKPLFTADFSDTRRAIHREFLAQDSSWLSLLLYNDY